MDTGNLPLTKYWMYHFFLLLLITYVDKTKGAADSYIYKLESDGVLSIFHGGKWGHICATDSGTKVPTSVAGSICQRMGYLSSGSTVSYSGVDVSLVTIDQFSCTGSSLDTCTLKPSNGASTCLLILGKPSGITLTCKSATHVHLIPEDSNVHKGIIEIFHANKQGYVCRDSEDNVKKVANVVCRQMGYQGGGTPLSDTTLPTGYSGKYFDATCTGTESSLDACTVKERTSSCTKVGRVECSLNTASQKTFDIQLSKFSKPTTGSGTVEVYHYGRWGVICDTGWDINDAHVVCRQLGYKEAVAGTGAPTKATFGQGTGLVLWNNVQCTGDELSLKECKHDVVFGTDSCNSVDASGVVCSSEKLPVLNMCDIDYSTITSGFYLLRSPGYSDKKLTTERCSFNSTNLSTGTTISAYVLLKQFKGNDVEYLSFYNESNEEVAQLYGKTSEAGPYTVSKIEFQPGNAGQGKFNIILKITVPVATTTPAAVTTAGMTGTPKSDEITDGNGVTNAGPTPAEQSEEPTMNLGMIVGIVSAVIGIAITAIIIFILYKKKKFPFKQKGCCSSVGSQEKAIDGQPPSGGGRDNHSYEQDGEEMKENVIYESAGPRSDLEAGKVGNGNVSSKNDVYAEVQPKLKRKKEAKEPETGETKNDVIRSRPASGSAVKVDIQNRAFNPDSKEEAPYDFEQAVPNSNAYDLEGTPRGFLPPINSTAYAEVDILPKPTPQAPEEPGKKDKKKMKEKEKKGKKDKKKKKMGNADEPKETPSSVCPPSSKAPAVPKGDSTAVPRFDDANAVTYAEVGALGVGQPVGEPSQADSGQADYDHLQFPNANKIDSPAQSGGDATYDVVSR